MRTDNSQISTYYTSMDVKQNVFCPDLWLYKKSEKMCKKNVSQAICPLFFCKKRQKKAVF